MQQFSTAATFVLKDWLKKEHTYALDVINDLLNGKHVLIGQYGLGGAITKDDFDISVLLNIKSNLEQGILIKEDRDRFDSAFQKSGNSIWNNIYKGIYSGQIHKLQTKDHESLCCVVFNNYTNTLKTKPDFIVDLEWLENMCVSKSRSLNININDKWTKSIALTDLCIINHLKGLGADLSNFRMERMRGHQRGQAMAIKYDEFVKQYTSAIGESNPNSVDPSDVIIYDTRYVQELEEIMRGLYLYSSLDPAKVPEMIRESLYKSGIPIFGSISLKQVQEYPTFKLVNLEESHIIVKSVEDVYINKSKDQKHPKTCTVILNGDFGPGITRARLEYRTTGETKGMRCEATMMTSDGRRAASQSGDCPISTFDKIVGMEDHRSENTLSKFSKFIVFVRTTDLSNLTTIVRAAKKEAPYCLPHILVQ